MMNLRNEAVQILQGIYLNGSFSNLSLRSLGKKYSSENTAYISQLVYGTLKRDLFVRDQWMRYVKKAPSEKLAVLLDCATYELLFMNSPHYAVINEAVEIAKHPSHASQASFVNSILRKVSANGLQEVQATSEDERLSLTYSMPLWIVKLWKKQYGEETMLQILESTQRNSRQYLRVNTLKVSVEELLKLDEKFLFYKEDAVTYEGNYIRSKWFQEGYIFPQDYHSQCVSRLTSYTAEDSVLDLCAAPGSKTFHMSALMQNQGSITAVDLYPKRTELIEKGAQKAGCTNIRTLSCDGREIAQYLPQHSFDKVFVDAPCSGLGVLRHKPEIKRSVTPSSLDEIQKIQAELLDAASEMVKEGGELIYSTCTLNTKENEKQAEAFLERHPEYILVKKQTLFPFEDEADGFFMVKLQKVQ